MIRIAIVDDDEKCRNQEKDFIERYGRETDEKFEITVFESGMDFITDYLAVFDIVFLDIEMPLLNGMATARKLRELDDKICIVFITHMAKYAIEGYAVNAIDFVVKPIKYFNFVDKLKKAICFVKSHVEKELVIKNDEDYFRVPVSQIYYVEKDKNYLIYNTARGKFRERGTIENAQKSLRDCGFSLCNSGCLVNLRLIQQVTQNCIFINGEQLPLSRRRLKDFKREMLSYLQKG